MLLLVTLLSLLALPMTGERRVLARSDGDDHGDVRVLPGTEQKGLAVADGGAGPSDGLRGADMETLLHALDGLELQGSDAKAYGEIELDDPALEESLLQSPAVLQALTDRDAASLMKPVNLSSTMLVSLADGKIVALDENTGELVWTVDTGSPLVMSSKDAASTEGIFPSTDGSLFTYKMNEDGTAGSVEKLPVKVKDLVDSSPSPTPQGNVVLGSQIGRAHV